MIAGTVTYQHAGTPAWLIPARPPLWYMEAIASMYTILASIGCGPHVSSSAAPLGRKIHRDCHKGKSRVDAPVLSLES
jgi:hypothetical protein